MTRQVSASLLAALVAGKTTLATCWKVVRPDGVVMGFTDHMEDMTIDGVVYEASTGGYTRTAIDNNSSLSVDNLELEGYLDSVVIKPEDLREGRFDRAVVTVFLVNYLDPTGAPIYLKYGDLGEVELVDNTYKTSLRGLSQRLTRKFVETYSPTCRAELFDNRCQASPAGQSRWGTVTSILGERAKFQANMLGSMDGIADGWFAGGILTWQPALAGSGPALNAGRAMEIKSYVEDGRLFTLLLPMPSDVFPGDVFIAVVGCDHEVDTCRTKFNNIVNFRGEPLVPITGGNEKGLAYNKPEPVYEYTDEDDNWDDD